GKSDSGGTVVSSPAGKGASTSGPGTTSGKDGGSGVPKTTSGKDGGKPPEADKTIRKPRFIVAGSRSVRDLALSPSGALLSWASDDKVHLWDVQANKRKAEQPAE